MATGWREASTNADRGTPGFLWRGSVLPLDCAVAAYPITLSVLLVPFPCKIPHIDRQHLKFGVHTVSSQRETLLCRYRYDPLDQLIGHTLSAEREYHLFYLKSRLATELQGAIQLSIFQHDGKLLAQQRQGNGSTTTLLATDLQRSILHTLQENNQHHPIPYCPYGYHPEERGLTSLFAFNGERPDPVTKNYLLGNGYRAFNPVLMRFNSPDSWSPFRSGGVNSYAYCNNDPLNQYDPTGHSSLFIGAQLVRWSRRAQVRLINRTHRIYLSRRPDPSSHATLKPGVSPIQAVNARARMYRILSLAELRRLQKIQFADDLQSARNNSLNLFNHAKTSVQSNPQPLERAPPQFHRELRAAPQLGRLWVLENLKDASFPKGINPGKKIFFENRSRNGYKMMNDYMAELEAAVDSHVDRYEAERMQILDTHFNLTNLNIRR